MKRRYNFKSIFICLMISILVTAIAFNIKINNVLAGPVNKFAEEQALNGVKTTKKSDIVSSFSTIVTDKEIDSIEPQEKNIQLTSSNKNTVSINLNNYEILHCNKYIDRYLIDLYRLDAVDEEDFWNNYRDKLIEYKVQLKLYSDSSYALTR